ncbi:MAG: four helix bundle protein [Proteobacteria bacterium]|nr:four helix bundle protein [Pseudomonadota bacterium]MCG2700942.1 four helix bundle protein [Candidatus Parcubacteria bacterium]
MDVKKYIKVQDLDIYKLARELSKIGWEIYSLLNWQDKKTMGDQFIRATDSFGANITEGYSRYYYLDKIRFFYNSRASLSEANDYWLEVMHERKKVEDKLCGQYKNIAVKCSIKLQNFISTNYKSRNIANINK